MILFAMHISYVLITNTIYLNVFAYRLYHSSADSTHPYNAFNNCRYITFTSFPYVYFCVFWIHLTHDSQKSTINFNMMISSPGMSALRYSPGTSKVTTSLSSCASIMRLVHRYSKELVGDDTSSLGM